MKQLRVVLCGVVRWAEKRAISGASLTLTPSVHDREELAALGIAPKGVAILPNGTSVRRSTPNMRVTQRRGLGLAPGTPTAIFVGRMDYPPNREALRLICTRIAPACPGVTFLLVGLNPPRMSVPPNVRLVGAVESVDPYLAASDLALVPILQGSGTRIKILDAWASGLPVLSTTAGAAGLDYQDGVHIAIEDEIERFPARIAELLSDPVQLARLRQGALVAAFPYRWETLGKQYVTSLEALVEGS